MTDIFQLPVTEYTFTNVQDWLDRRLKDITSTDVASLFGRGFQTVNEVYESKKHGYDKNTKANPLLIWGQKVETPIAEMFSEVYGIEIKKNDVYKVRGILGASYDYEITGISPVNGMMNIPQDLLELIEKHKRINLEIKSVIDMQFREHWEGQGLPMKYFYQTQTQMFCDGEYDASVVVTFHNGAVHYRIVEKDEFVMEEIYNRATKFKEQLDNNTPPEIEDYLADLDVINYRIKNNYVYEKGKNAEKDVVKKYFRAGNLRKKIERVEKSMKAEMLGCSKEFGVYNGYELKKHGAGIRIVESEFVEVSDDSETDGE